MIWQKNPFTMRGHLRRTLIFNFRTPEEAARQLLPPQLEPVTLGGFAFWGVVVCEMTAMRPAGVPEALGVAFQQVGYRLHVRARLANGGSVEGLHFLRSDCDRALVTRTGNWLTDFHFHTARIAVSATEAKIEGRVEVPGANVRFQLDGTRRPELAPGSPFSSIEEAAAFLKYKPFGISLTPTGALNVVQVHRHESDWRSRPVTVESAHWEYFEGQPLTLELCSVVEPVDYQWNRGEIMEVAQ